jgi:hypothetical protein
MPAVDNNVNYRTPGMGLLTPAANNDDRKNQVAAGVGLTAGASQAGKFMGKRALKANSAAQAESTLQGMFTHVVETSNAVRDNAKVTSGLWATFKSNIQFYTRDITKRLESLKSVKFIGRIANSPIAKKAAGVVGGSLAFFVLVTGLSKAAKTGQIAIDDFKNKYRDMDSFYNHAA